MADIENQTQKSKKPTLFSVARHVRFSHFSQKKLLQSYEPEKLIQPTSFPIQNKFGAEV